jgi:hypothetical protein
MKKLQSLALSVILSIGGISITHGQQYFNTFDGRYAPSKGKQYIIPDNYKIFSANNSSLQSFLHGLNSKPGKEQTIQLPTPDGSYRTFRVWKTSMMEKALQEKYAAIETFTAEALDNPQITAKLDFTLNGFHAMIFNGSRTFFIDPYTDAFDGYYMAYYKNDYHRSINARMVCGLDNSEVADANGHLSEQLGGAMPHLEAKQFGTTQRTYRLALSCTGEYAQAVGGGTPTITSVLSAMVTSMNRVNGIYERELGITMQLINNNDLLIYLNPGTDPFMSNNNGAQLLTQNANNTANVIGNANYDIGHIFSTGGGGIAQLGCVCTGGNNKARGVTGSANPVGDAYDVDYVAHEMGHQFGAQHTFNSNEGACQGNGEFDVAYEPGSGTTIMAYAGICGNDNILQNSSAYFHAKSLDQISDFVTIQATTCAVTQTGVSAPELAEIADTFFIPVGTPFELTSPVAATDSTDTLSYCWEQWDLGNFGQSEHLGASFTNGPCYRSFTPSVENVRVFPPIERIISGNLSAIGMRMPTVSRALDFKVTVRSIYEGFGTFNISEDELRANVVDSVGPFVVTFPVAATDSFEMGGNATVTWDVANTDVAPVNAAGVDIFLSVDGGFTYPFTLAANVPNDGSETVTLPDTATVNARVKVKGAGNIFFNISQSNFKIYDTASGGLGMRELLLSNDINVYPNPAKGWINIKNISGSKLTLRLYNVVGQSVWSGTMTKDSVIPVENLSRGMYYLQLIDQRSGTKVVKPVTLQ